MSSGVLRITKNYAKFEPLPQNRTVNKKRAERLRASMIKHGFINAYPIHCVVNNGNGKLKIKDGHYRFEVAQELGLPLSYVVCKDEASLQELVGSIITWNLPDYKNSYINAGIKPYVDLGQYLDETGIPTSRAIALFSGKKLWDGGGQLDSFKAGGFKIVDTKTPFIVAELVLLCKNVGCKFARNAMFVNAISRVIAAEGFNMIRMKAKIKAHCHRMKKQPSIDDYITMLDKTFNYHVSTEELTPLSANALKASRKNVKS